jgi:hypothetical protein
MALFGCFWDKIGVFQTFSIHSDSLRFDCVRMRWECFFISDRREVRPPAAVEGGWPRTEGASRVRTRVRVLLEGV